MNQKVVIDIKLQGTFCNHWPQAKITFNDQLIYFSEVENSKILNFELDCSVNNRLTIEHLGKSFGQNNIWDTDQHNDCVLKIQDIQLDQVSIGKELHSNLIFVTNWASEQLTQNSEEFIKKYSVIENCMGQMNFNGTINFDFEVPVYEWLIKEKFINPSKKFTLNTYSGQGKFDYEYILNKINSMKQLF
jgi:hypothetical protein